MITQRRLPIPLILITLIILILTACGSSALSKEPVPVVKPIPPECDFIIDKARIVDGTGNPGFIGSVAVKGELITAVGEFPFPGEAEVVDGSGLVLSPGFIDIHTHSETFIHSGERTAAFLSQGVTTQIGGNCGRSPENIRGYLETMPPLDINYGILMGYATLREKAMGNRAGKTSTAALENMKKDLDQALLEGALGLSTGLEYWPQNYATTEELVELCQIVAQHGGFYATHIRNEYDKVIPALKEAIEIGRKAQVPVQYSHIKAGYERNWQQFSMLLELLEEAHESGLDITADVYPYTFSSTDLGKSPLRDSISRENMEKAMIHPLIFYGSDTGIYQGGTANHPRAYGTFTRILGEMVRERGLLSLENAVVKMTSQPARRLKLKDRGVIAPGYIADLVLFDPKTIRDLATIEDPTLISEGIQQVWVSGSLAWDMGKLTNNRNGKIIMSSYKK